MLKKVSLFYSILNSIYEVDLTSLTAYLNKQKKNLKQVSLPDYHKIMLMKSYFISRAVQAILFGRKFCFFHWFPFILRYW